MINYYPDSFLLNNVYIPFYIKPNKNILNCKDNLSIETGINGLQSTINLFNNESNFVPFIDISKYDSDTKSWFWFDEEGFPLRISRHTDGIKWVLKPMFNISRLFGSSLTFDPESLMPSDNGPNLGFYSIITEINEIPSDLGIKVYNGSPIILRITGKTVKDLTDYNTFNNDINLSDYNTDANREFYYNLQLNKIYTNQNLTSYDVSKIELYCFITINKVKIKCLLSGNSGMNNYATPAIDYFIAKLHGQYLKG